MSSHPTTDDTGTLHESGAREFVDYEPPPAVKVLPPAKYKLWIIIFVLVYFSSWAAAEAELRQALEFDGWLSFNASLFLQLSIIVFVLVYAAVDLLQICLTFRTNDGKLYGVVAWLKQPRAQWVYQHENFFFEVMARVIHILEEGFAMFDAPPLNATPNARPQHFDCKDPACQATLKIEHRLKPDKLEEYNKWIVRIGKAVQQNEGVVGKKVEEIRKEVGDEEKGGAEAAKDVPYLAVVYVKFANIDYLNDWMANPRRNALMTALDPMLATPDVTQIARNRDLPDAFSDLLIRQGNSAPKSPPKKWKVWWLTVLALNITVHWTISFLPYYLDKWEMSDLDHRLRRIVELFIATFLNSYVMSPLFLFLFDPWLKDSDKKNLRQPWKTFDKGIETVWVKLALSLAFYGGCVIAILVKKY